MVQMTVRGLVLITGVLLAVVALAGPDFHRHIESEPRPWTDKNFDTAPDKFTFAVFADITGGRRPGVFSVAVEQLNLLRPELIVNVGDLIEGSDDPNVVAEEWAVFGRLADRARAPVFYTGGNHDLLGVALQSAWTEGNGPSYYHFVYKNVLFLVLDTEDHTPERLAEIAKLRAEAFQVADEQGWDAFYETEYLKVPENKAGNISTAQAEYFVDTLAEHADVRHTFVLMHKAPWLREDLEAFRTIESALAERPYTVFHGHEHGYVHRTRHGRDYIQLATTGGVFLPDNGDAYDQLLLVTVDDDVTIANLKLSGILDKTGRLPLNGAELCLEYEDCPDD